MYSAVAKILQTSVLLPMHSPPSPSPALQPHLIVEVLEGYVVLRLQLLGCFGQNAYPQQKPEGQSKAQTTAPGGIAPHKQTAHLSAWVTIRIYTNLLVAVFTIVCCANKHSSLLASLPISSCCPLHTWTVPMLVPSHHMLQSAAGVASLVSSLQILSLHRKHYKRTLVETVVLSGVHKQFTLMYQCRP